VGQDGGGYRFESGQALIGIFSSKGLDNCWTEHAVICPSGKSAEPQHRHCERSEANHQARKKEWIAHMGNVCVKDEQSPFCSTAATSSSRPRGVQDGARRSSQGRPFRAAAQRLGLELSEHAIMLGPSGTTGAPCFGGSVRASAILSFGDPRFEPVRRSGLPCQTKTHIRSSREATAPGFRLRRAGSRGRDHSSLRG